MSRFIGNHGVVPTTSAPFVSEWVPSNLSDRIVGTVFSDVAGTLYIEQSPNGADADVSASFPVLANDGTGVSEEIVGQYYRVRFVPGTNGAAFRLAVRTNSAGIR